MANGFLLGALGGLHCILGQWQIMVKSQLSLAFELSDELMLQNPAAFPEFALPSVLTAQHQHPY